MALLTVSQLQTQVPSTAAADTDLLQMLLDAAENDINELLGPISPVSSSDATGTINELIRVHGDLLGLSRRASSIVQIIENDVTLDATDYELRSDGMIVKRLHATTSTHPSYRWWGLVDVTYTFDDLANRQRVQIALVKLDLDHSPGSSQETIGSWTEMHSQGASWNYQTERQAILASLVPAPAAIW